MGATLGLSIATLAAALVGPLYMLLPWHLDFQMGSRWCGRVETAVRTAHTCFSEDALTTLAFHTFCCKAKSAPNIERLKRWSPNFEGGIRMASHGTAVGACQTYTLTERRIALGSRSVMIKAMIF